MALVVDVFLGLELFIGQDDLLELFERIQGRFNNALGIAFFEPAQQRLHFRKAVAGGLLELRAQFLKPEVVLFVD